MRGTGQHRSAPSRQRVAGAAACSVLRAGLNLGRNDGLVPPGQPPVKAPPDFAELRLLVVEALASRCAK